MPPDASAPAFTAAPRAERRCRTRMCHPTHRHQHSRQRRVRSDGAGPECATRRIGTSIHGSAACGATVPDPNVPPNAPAPAPQPHAKYYIHQCQQRQLCIGAVIGSLGASASTPPEGGPAQRYRLSLPPSSDLPLSASTFAILQSLQAAVTHPHPAFPLPHPASRTRIPHPASRIPHPASRIPASASLLPRFHAARDSCMAPHTHSNPPGPGASERRRASRRQRATRSARDERTAPRVRALPNAHLCGDPSPLHRSPGARRGDERGSARRRGPPPRGGSHGPPSAALRPETSEERRQTQSSASRFVERVDRPAPPCDATGCSSGHSHSGVERVDRPLPPCDAMARSGPCGSSRPREDRNSEPAARGPQQRAGRAKTAAASRDLRATGPQLRRSPQMSHES
jgi:hypothetical protein